MKKIRMYYQNLKIKEKFFILISIILLSLTFFAVIGLRYIMKVYDDQIFLHSSQVLAMTSYNIEDELNKVENISYNIAIDPQIQHLLIQLNEKEYGLEQYQIQREIEDILIKFIGNEKYIRTIYLVDLNGNVIVSGISETTFIDEKIEDIISNIKDSHGEITMVENSHESNLLTASRKIRSYSTLEFEDIGYLIMRINIGEIVKNINNNYLGNEGDIFISNQDEVFYSESLPILDEIISDISLTQRQDYQVLDINGVKYFITYMKSLEYSNWIYWNAIPYEALFQTINNAKGILVILFFFVFIIIYFFGYKFSKRITQPVGELVEVMKQVEKGEFESVQGLNPKNIDDDEIGLLYRNFVSMVERIDHLIKENYVKELLIEKTRFKALQAQINPHFLYNTLDSINWMAKANKQNKISQMVESLGYLLRNAMDIKSETISISEELMIVQHYITIQKIRFEERLNVNINVPNHILDYSILKLSLQPIVENSIKHALEVTLEPCFIEIRGYIKDKKIYIEIEDNGPGVEAADLFNMDNHTNKHKGIGLNNINERIKLTFGSQYGLDILSEKNKGTIVTLILPMQEQFKKNSVIRGDDNV